MSIETRFLDFMCAAGLSPVKEFPATDGRIHRYRVEGDKAGSRNGWYSLHLLPIPHGAVGSWRTGETHSWRDQAARPINWNERQELHRQTKRIQNQRYQEQLEVWKEGRAKAEKMLGLSGPAAADHPYLVKKRVKAWGIRQLRQQLIIPVRDRDGQLHSLQFIGPDGSKKFLTGGRVSGNYYAIGRPSETVCICEGYATAASVYEATGHATAVAFNAGNLVFVARKLRIKFPRVKIVVIADDDHETPGNPGLTQAFSAAGCVDGWVARPDFSEVAA